MVLLVDLELGELHVVRGVAVTGADDLTCRAVTGVKEKACALAPGLGYPVLVATVVQEEPSAET
ncbi:hypothetical protein GCM10020219_076040 [Nonomuraea dietziae]